LPATPCLTLPVAVNLKRFFTPLLVLSLGIFVSCCLLRALVNGAQTICERTRQPLLAGPSH
jgi:hypothetical protein